MAESAVATEDMTDEQAVQNGDSGARAQSVEFSEVAEGVAAGPGTSVDFLLDMEVPITVKLGQAEIPIQRLLQLNAGSVVRLDKSIDMPVELYLKDSMFAMGKVVVVDDNFAVQITDILDVKSSEK